MRSIRHKLFHQCFQKLPPNVQKAAATAFEKWKQDPSSVDWHRLSGTHANLYAADIGYSARAIGVVTQDAEGTPACVWIFVGTHETYNHFINIQRQRKNQDFLNLDALKHPEIERYRQAQRLEAQRVKQQVHLHSWGTAKPKRTKTS